MRFRMAMTNGLGDAELIGEGSRRHDQRARARRCAAHYPSLCRISCLSSRCALPDHRRVVD